MGDREKFAQEVQVVDKATERAVGVDVDGGMQVHLTNPGEIGGGLTDTELRASAVAVTDSPALTELQAAVTHLAAVVSELQGTLTVDTGLSTQTDALTDTQLRASALTVNTGLTTQTDALTDTQLRATAVTVDTGLSTQTDALTDTQLRAAAVPVTGGLTDAELRAAAVPVTGGLTDTQLRATAVSVDTGLTTQTDALTDAELRASAVTVADDFGVVEYTSDQTGADTVLSFTLSLVSPKVVKVDVDPVVADDYDNYRCRATTDGTAPTSTLGEVCRPGASFLLTAGTTVKVYAPTGVVVNVTGYGRA